VPKSGYQRRHYDELVRTRRATRYGLSCGWAARYDPTLLERRPLLRLAWARLLDRIFGDGRVGSLLDLGCGTTYYWSLLGDRCERIVGVDISPSMLGEGRGELGERLAAEVGELPFDDEVFDAVLAVDALHHASRLDRALGEARRVLRRGGLFAAVEPNVWNPVVFLAHLMPPEERGALWPNHPLALRRALEGRFESVRVEPVTYVSGIDWEAGLRLVEAMDPLLRRPPLSLISLRRIIRARRP
jgi:SAM-dependent methyltransferase